MMISVGNSQPPPRKIFNEAFKPGERIQLRFYYDAWLTGKVMAGIGIAEVKNTDRTFTGRPVYHLDTEGFSKGLFHLFYKVHDQFDSYVDKETLAPYLLIRRTREGGFEKDDEYHFNQQENYVVTRSDSMEIPPYTQDFISAVYYARTFNSDTLEVGDIFHVPFFIDDSVYKSAVIYEGKEIVEIKLGTFRCLRLKPMMATGEVFTEKYPMTLWVSDDKNHIPILAKSAVFVGNIKMELMEYEGLANPFTALIELNE
jgi:hypothetical protein